MRNESAASESRGAAPAAWRPAHAWAYVLLHGLAVTAALWQHGHPGYTLTVLTASGLFLGVPHVPRRWLDATSRRRVQYVLLASLAGWLWYRAQAGTPLDLLLFEGLAGLGLTLAWGTRPRDFGYLLLVAALLLGYGALAPPRLVCAAVLPLAGGLALEMVLG